MAASRSLPDCGITIHGAGVRGFLGLSLGWGLVVSFALAAEVDGTPPQPLAAGALVDYRPLAFQPQVWDAKKVSTLLLAWPGTNLVFLTTNGVYDARLLKRWVERLDQGWSLYADLMGSRPKPFKILAGKATIAAVPDFDFTCGAGCGYVGATGIELAMFYGWNYPSLLRNPDAMPHYAFYEMGRNFYTLGDRHSAFTTGFAVFMRYVCMDTLGCVDEDRETRRTIEGVEPLIRTSGLSFLKTFTNCDGLSEKEPRVRDAQSNWVNPSDQPVTYASAMLRLWREQGGNGWARRFFHALAECPEAPGNDRAAALAQSWNWLVAASVAAGRDLTPIFVDDWHLPLSGTTRKEFSSVPWAQKGVSAATVIRRIQPQWN
jgi:hypothetical protein